MWNKTPTKIPSLPHVKFLFVTNCCWGHALLTFFEGLANLEIPNGQKLMENTIFHKSSTLVSILLMFSALKTFIKVRKILKGSLDLIPSPSSSVKIQIMDKKVCLMCKGKTLLDIVNKLWKQKICWHHPAMFCLCTQVNFPAYNLNFYLRWRSNPGYLLKYFLL